jgi:hypothetical protein
MLMRHYLLVDFGGELLGREHGANHALVDRERVHGRLLAPELSVVDRHLTVAALL